MRRYSSQASPDAPAQVPRPGGQTHGRCARPRPPTLPQQLAADPFRSQPLLQGIHPLRSPICMVPAASRDIAGALRLDYYCWSASVGTGGPAGGPAALGSYPDAQHVKASSQCPTRLFQPRICCLRVHHPVPESQFAIPGQAGGCLQCAGGSLALGPAPHAPTEVGQHAMPAAVAHVAAPCACACSSPGLWACAPSGSQADRQSSEGLAPCCVVFGRMRGHCRRHFSRTTYTNVCCAAAAR